jgi:sialic acid synthase SpsE
MYLILDIGSTHMGKKDYCFEFIEKAKEAGADAVKFQMFKPDSAAGKGNIALPYQWFYAFRELGDKLGINVFSSCWDFEGVNTLITAGCDSIKFAYSQTGNKGLIDYAREHFPTIYLSYDIMNRPTTPQTSQEKWLYCIPEYPVKYDVNFEKLFPFFDGFSDHTMGVFQSTKAMIAGARIIEKHVKLGYTDINCPDSRFAVGFHNVCMLVDTMKGLSQ